MELEKTAQEISQIRAIYQVLTQKIKLCQLKISKEKNFQRKIKNKKWDEFISLESSYFKVLGYETEMIRLQEQLTEITPQVRQTYQGDLLIRYWGLIKTNKIYKELAWFFVLVFVVTLGLVVFESVGQELRKKKQQDLSLVKIQRSVLLDSQTKESIMYEMVGISAKIIEMYPQDAQLVNLMNINMCWFNQRIDELGQQRAGLEE